MNAGKSQEGMKEKTEQVAREVKVTTGNGNREQVSDKPGSAEKGGPDLEKAQDRQPPDATRPFEEDNSGL